MRNSTNNRSLVNIIGIPVISISIYYDFLFLFTILIILIFSSVEYSKMISRLNSEISILILSLFNLIFFLNAYFSFFPPLNLMILFFILFFLYEILFYNYSSVQNIAFYFMGIFWIAFCLCSSLLFIREMTNGFYFTYLLFFSIWVCDTFAFFFGSKFGNKKILPIISPNKTWVGSICGLIGSFIVFFSFYLLNIEFEININFIAIDIVALSMITGIIGQLGDFGESLIKRQADIKNTSSFLMGHGGFLDRFDSLAFAAPVYYMYISAFII